MRSQTVKISSNLKVKKFTDTKLSDFNILHIENREEAKGGWIFERRSAYDMSGVSRFVNGMLTHIGNRYLDRGDGFVIWFERNRSVFRLVQNDSKLNVEDIVAGVKGRASELGSGTIAITDLAPYYYMGEIRIYSGIGIFYAGDINVEVLSNLIHRIYNQKY